MRRDARQLKYEWKEDLSLNSCLNRWSTVVEQGQRNNSSSAKDEDRKYMESNALTQTTLAIFALLFKYRQPPSLSPYITHITEYQKLAVLERQGPTDHLLPPMMLPVEDLPGPAHAIIASMLPDGDKSNNRLRLSEVSRYMINFYGGTLTTLHVRQRDQYPVAELASLLWRQRKLEQVTVTDIEIPPKLTPSIKQGCFRHVRELIMELHFNKDDAWALEEYNNEDDASDLDLLGSLTTAMQVPGVLQALEVLCFHKKRLNVPFPFGIVEMLAGALASGAAPFLRNLYLGGDRGGMLTDDAVEALVAMFEARSQCLACRRLEVL